MLSNFIKIVAFLLLGFCGFAQEQNIQIQLVIDESDHQTIYPIKISNDRTQQTVFSDSLGYANLLVQIGDQIVLESDFYTNRTFNISSSIYLSQKAKINLNPQPIILPQAQLGFKLTGDLAKDAKNANYIDKATIVYNNLGIKEKDVPPPNPNGQRPEKGLSLTNLIGMINGYNRKQNLKFEYQKHLDQVHQIRDYFPISVINELQIPENKINEFFIYLNEKSDIYQYVKINDLLAAEKILIEQSLIYKDILQSLTNQ